MSVKKPTGAEKLVRNLISSKLPPDAPVELHLLLCKALRDGQITEELRWRTWSFLDHLYHRHQPREGFHQVAVVSGGMGEATAVRQWLDQAQGLLHQSGSGFVGLFGAGIAFQEMKSPNSRLNVAFAVRDVRERGLHGKIKAYLHSSDYHCRDLVELRYKLPAISPFSFVQELGVILDVIEMPAPYLYPKCGIKELEWRAQVYLIRQGLRLVWENIRGISGVAGKEEERIPLQEREDLGLIVKPFTISILLPESVARIEHALTRFKELLRDLPKPQPEFKERVDAARKEVEDFLTQVGKHVAWLRKHAGNRVEPRELDEWRKHANALEPPLNPSNAKGIDPDAIGFLPRQTFQVVPA